MKVLAVGGGSGGHVTPVVAVLREIRKSHPEAEIRFWCDKKFNKQAQEIMGYFDKTIPVQTIFAGKFRRYHNISIIRQLLWPSVVASNVRDGFLIIAGLFQSIFKLLIWRPNVIFAKGGYVCLPVGIAAHILRVPLVIHDSDAHPGLTSRVLSKWAKEIATGAPLEYYRYPAKKACYVGIPVADEFHQFSDSQRQAAKLKWGINPDYPLVVITGGGLGASRINDAVVTALDDLLKICSVVLISGMGQYNELRSVMPQNNDRFQLHSFVSKDIALLFGAANFVVTRAGATTILELAALVMPTILVPNGRLTGGHQLKNAAVYLENDAVKVIDEDEIVKNPASLVLALQEMISSPEAALQMAQRLALFARPNAARDVAIMVMRSAN